MRLLINDEIPKDSWNSFLSKNPYNSVFQTPYFYYFFNSISSLSAEVFAVEEVSDIRALCVVTIQNERGIKKFFSRRAIIYGGPIVTKEYIKEFEFLIQSICNNLKTRVIYIEVRNFFDYSQFNSLFSDAGWKYLPYLNISLGLKGKNLNDLLDSMKYNRRREIKLSLTEGAAYRVAENTFEVEKLYMILYELYFTKLKLPLPNINFFTKLFKSSIGKVFIVTHENKIIGGSFCLFSKMDKIYTLYYCGLRNYHKKIFPTHLAVLAAIDFGIENNLEYLDFMGAGIKGKEYGVRKYKQEFGGLMVENGRFLHISQPFLYHLSKTGLRIYKKIRI
jgi:serine/alanine adding enzyme